MISNYYKKYINHIHQIQLINKIIIYVIIIYVYFFLLYIVFINIILDKLKNYGYYIK